VLAGSRDLPDTNLMKRTLSSFENSSRVCQNHCTNWCCSSTSLYRTTFFRTSTDISGIPQTICSNCLAVRRDSKGTGTIQDIPSLTAATYGPKKRRHLKCRCLTSATYCAMQMQELTPPEKLGKEREPPNICQIQPPTYALPQGLYPLSKSWRILQVFLIAIAH